MAEREPSDNTAGSQDQSGTDGIDAALAKASRLTEGLVSELGGRGDASAEDTSGIGQGEQAADATAHASAGEAGSSDAAPIDDQLNKVEGLLEETRVQIGGGKEPAEDRGEPAAAAEGVSEPDMASFRQDGGRKPGVHPTMGDLGDLEAASGAPGLTAVASPPEAPQPQTPGPSEETNASEGPAVSELGPAPRRCWQRMPYRAVEWLSVVLDLVDRPFARVGYGVRQVLGLCAMVTLLGALAVLAIAYLR